VVERGLAASRSQAQALLLAGRVLVGAGDGARRDHKPGDSVLPDIALELVAAPRFVSRGGDKLDAALEAFGISVAGRVCLDVGSSTGGFTDVLLQRGAARVYALDVGRGQLAEGLRSDPRVISMERTHADRLDPSHPQAVSLGEQVSLVVIDVSFISLTRVLPSVLPNMTADGEIVALVKPQFEAGPKGAPKGVVRDEAVRQAAVDKVRRHAESLGLVVRGEIVSPLTGPAGNVEYLLHMGRQAAAAAGA
jgi:23S rRNA (cytidine1920-2'-O)/16S rRNA (cytidine1409-2'-O)-methyltransferase